MGLVLLGICGFHWISHKDPLMVESAESGEWFFTAASDKFPITTSPVT
ncbi:MAG: hypothetical protein R3B93_00740 [Bacteroidia bacterium]